MHEAIKELQDQGFAIPDYPEDATEGEALEIRSRYDAIKGSAVNPVLREGNSDRRAPVSVKNFAKKFQCVPFFASGRNPKTKPKTKNQKPKTKTQNQNQRIIE